MNNKTTIVNHNLCLYNMPFLLSRIVYHMSSLIYWPWNLLFSRIYESKKAWEILFNFLWRFQPFGYLIHLLWNRYALCYQTFYLLNISADGALIQIKEKAR